MAGRRTTLHRCLPCVLRTTASPHLRSYTTTQLPSPPIYRTRYTHSSLTAPFAQVLHDQCGVAEKPELWSALPHMLALTLTLPKWGSVKPDLSQDTITGNLHCMALAVRMPRAYYARAVRVPCTVHTPCACHAHAVHTL